MESYDELTWYWTSEDSVLLRSPSHCGISFGDTPWHKRSRSSVSSFFSPIDTTYLPPPF